MSARRCGQPGLLRLRSSVLLALLVGSCCVTAPTTVAQTVSQTVAQTVPATLNFNQHVRPIMVAMKLDGRAVCDWTCAVRRCWRVTVVKRRSSPVRHTTVKWFDGFIPRIRRWSCLLRKRSAP